MTDYLFVSQVAGISISQEQLDMIQVYIYIDQLQQMGIMAGPYKPGPGATDLLREAASLGHFPKRENFPWTVMIITDMKGDDLEAVQAMVCDLSDGTFEEKWKEFENQMDEWEQEHGKWQPGKDYPD